MLVECRVVLLSRDGDGCVHIHDDASRRLYRTDVDKTIDVMIEWNRRALRELDGDSAFATVKSDLWVVHLYCEFSNEARLRVEVGSLVDSREKMLSGYLRVDQAKRLVISLFINGESPLQFAQEHLLHLNDG